MGALVDLAGHTKADLPFFWQSMQNSQLVMQVKCGSINQCVDQQEGRSSARERKIISRKEIKLLIPNTHNSTAANSTRKHITNTRKMVPITGRASSILEKNVFLKSNLNQIHSFFLFFLPPSPGPT